ncbi:MAG: amidohydrolase family protein [Cyanobacteria bacterium RUI128]|nr:amidohydrolase family protein [Cyanobacteria bacterium RUI128]
MVKGISAGLSAVNSNLSKFNLNGYRAFLNGDVYRTSGQFRRENLYFGNGRVLKADRFKKEIRDKKDDVEIIDLHNDYYVTPALVDQHIHGGFGMDFNRADESEMREFLKRTNDMGYSAILATFVPAKPETLNRQMDIVRKIMRNPDKGSTKIAGINLEGPFLNPDKAGIHPPEILLEPTVENLKKLNLEDVKMVTLAPELDRNYEAVNYLNEHGIIASAGHSNATANQVRESGITQVTHLFNAMSGYHHRIPTIANEGLINDNITAEVNTAFELITPQTIDLVKRVKPDDKVIFISDALSGANISENHFDMNGKRINIEDGVAKDKDNVLAGSIRFMGQLAKKIVDSTTVTFGEFINYAARNPAKNLGIESKSSFAEGSKPDFIIWEKSTLKPVKTFIND